MRKYLLGLFAIMMAVSLSAFTSAKSSKEVGKTAPLYWFSYSASTSTLGSYLGNGEKAAFITGSCDNSGVTDCRRGYTDEELVNPAIPDQGVQHINANEDEITRQ